VIADNCQILPSAPRLFRLDKTEDACHLIIDKVTPDLAGTYTCLDKISSERSHWAELVVRLCPAQFTFSPQAKLCFKIITKLTTWTEAQSNCRQLHKDATLVVIKNRQQHGILKNAITVLPQRERNLCFVSKHGSTQFFTSGQRRVVNDCNSPFVWKPGSGIPESDVKDVAWNTGQPDCAFGNENCVTMSENYPNNLNDNSCTSFNYCFICQIPIS